METASQALEEHKPNSVIPRQGGSMPSAGLLLGHPVDKKTLELLEEFISNQDSVTTKQIYSYELRKFFSFVGKLDLGELSQRDILAYKESISSLKPATIARKLCTIRQFVKFVHERGFLNQDIGKGVKLPKVYQGDRLFLDELEAQALLNAPDRRTVKGKRDYAILHLMLCTGVRLKELIESKVGDLGERYKKPVLQVLGKGKKPRIANLGGKVVEAIDDYLKSRKGVEKGHYLFVGAFKNGVGNPSQGVESQKLSSRGIQKMVKRYAKTALIQKNVSPHTLRHTTATLELLGGADVVAIKEQLGHSSLSTTQIYTHSLKSALDSHPLYSQKYFQKNS